MVYQFIKMPGTVNGKAVYPV